MQVVLVMMENGDANLHKKTKWRERILTEKGFASIHAGFLLFVSLSHGK